MTTAEEQEAEALASLVNWVGELGQHVELLAELSESSTASQAVRDLALRCLLYWSEMLALGLSGVEELLLSEVALAFRAFADSALLASLPDSAGGSEHAMSLSPPLGDFRQGAAVCRLLLASDYEKFARHCAEWRPAAGEQFGQGFELEPLAREQLVAQARTWNEGYAPPVFGDAPYALIKVRAFFAKKLSV